MTDQLSAAGETSVPGLSKDTLAPQQPGLWFPIVLTVKQASNNNNNNNKDTIIYGKVNILSVTETKLEAGLMQTACGDESSHYTQNLLFEEPFNENILYNLI